MELPCSLVDTVDTRSRYGSQIRAAPRSGGPGFLVVYVVIGGERADRGLGLAYLAGICPRLPVREYSCGFRMSGLSRGYWA